MTLLLGIAAHIGVLALDVTLFMLFSKYLSILWPVSPFTNFAKVGEPLVAPLIAATKRVGNVSYRASFFWSSLLLSVGRLALVTISNSFILAS